MEKTDIQFFRIYDPSIILSLDEVLQSRWDPHWIL